MFFSPSTGGFYDAAIHSDLFIEQVDTDLEGVTTDRYMVPDPDGPIADAVEITAKEHAILLEGQSQGKLIVAGKGGKPGLADPAPPTAPQVWEHIKAERDRRKAGGVKVGAKWFHTDDASRIQNMTLNMMGASIPANLQWKTMDGSFVTMTQVLAGQVFQAVALLDMQAFTKAEEHRIAMEASNDPANYDFSAGWPASFEG